MGRVMSIGREGKRIADRDGGVRRREGGGERCGESKG